MFGHRSFLVLGGGAGDILSLVKGGFEISDYKFAFQQGIDQKGKATTKVYGGSVNLVLSQLPPQEIIDWGIDSRKYKDGAIIVLDTNNLPLERIIFQNAACIAFEVGFTDADNSYASTTLSIQAEKLIVGTGIPFENEWALD